MPKSLKWMYLFIGLQEGKQEISQIAGAIILIMAM